MDRVGLSNMKKQDYSIQLISCSVVTLTMLTACFEPDHSEVFKQRVKSSLKDKPAVVSPLKPFIDKQWKKACVYQDPLHMFDVAAWINFVDESGDNTRVDLLVHDFIIEPEIKPNSPDKRCFSPKQALVFRSIKINGQKRILVTVAPPQSYAGKSVQ